MSGGCPDPIFLTKYSFGPKLIWNNKYLTKKFFDQIFLDNIFFNQKVEVGTWNWNLELELEIGIGTWNWDLEL